MDNEAIYTEDIAFNKQHAFMYQESYFLKIIEILNMFMPSPLITQTWNLDNACV